MNYLEKVFGIAGVLFVIFAAPYLLYGFFKNYKSFDWYDLKESMFEALVLFIVFLILGALMSLPGGDEMGGDYYEPNDGGRWVM